MEPKLWLRNNHPVYVFNAQIWPHVKVQYYTFTVLYVVLADHIVNGYTRHQNGNSSEQSHGSSDFNAMSVRRMVRCKSQFIGHKHIMLVG